MRQLRQSGTLPPVSLYKTGEAYFVLDGNHRVRAPASALGVVGGRVAVVGGVSLRRRDGADEGQVLGV